MKIIPFDINLRKDIQSEENKYTGRYKVQTREGEPVRIICWDKEGSEFQIVALVMNHSVETPLSFCKNGEYLPNRDNDLYLVDTWEPKFKIGDKVKYKCSNTIYTIKSVEDTGYVLSNGGFTLFKNENEFELVPEEPELKEIEKDLEKELANWVKKYAPRLLELAEKEIIEKLKEE